jgi:hypothetical protein
MEHFFTPYVIGVDNIWELLPQRKRAFDYCFGGRARPVWKVCLSLPVDHNHRYCFCSVLFCLLAMLPFSTYFSLVIGPF